MADKVPLSVVILTKNEASRIADCLRSVQWADELLVIDDESTDETVPIAQSLGARVLRRKMDIEGRHRNWAYAQARNEWVLSLDADERVSLELAEEIQTLLTTGSPFEVYAIPRRNYIGSRWIRYGGWYPSAQVKLFKRSIFQWEETTVHPRAISNRPWGTLKGDVIHFSYRDVSDFIEKMNRQTTLEAQKWLREGRRVTLGKAIWRAVDRVFRTCLGKQGYRDGIWGFVVAIMAGLYQVMAWVKYWEKRRDVRVEEIVEPFRSLITDQERLDSVLLMSHLCAYRTAGGLAHQKRVLEIGFGSGYGAFYLAHVAREVVAIDIDRVVLEQAPSLFPRPNLRYLPMEATRLAFRDGNFDLVGTFQVIEHIPEQGLPTFLREIARVLAPDGTLVVSTMNLEHNLKRGKTNYQKLACHEKEFIPSEFRALLETVFPVVEVYGLYPRLRYRVYRRLKKWGLDQWGPAPWNPVRRFFAGLDTDDHCLRTFCNSRAIDLIGICRKRAPKHPPLEASQERARSSTRITKDEVVSVTA